MIISTNDIENHNGSISSPICDETSSLIPSAVPSPSPITTTTTTTTTITDSRRWWHRQWTMYVIMLFIKSGNLISAIIVIVGAFIVCSGLLLAGGDHGSTLINSDDGSLLLSSSSSSSLEMTTTTITTTTMAIDGGLDTANDGSDTECTTTTYNLNHDYVFEQYACHRKKKSDPAVDCHHYYCWTHLPHQYPRDDGNDTAAWKLVSTPPCAYADSVSRGRCTRLHNTYYSDIDSCFQDERDHTHNHYCWDTENTIPKGNWKRISAPPLTDGTCGKKCTQF